MGRNGNYLQAAFDAVCTEAKRPEGHYVALMETVRTYLGPWEGGTWGDETFIVAYQWFATREEAAAAAAAVQALCVELDAQARREHGDQCLREMDWCEARGLDADYLPEPDGASEYHVVVSDSLPRERRCSRTYE